MPWIKKAPPDPFHWTVAIVAVGALSVGVLIGYTKWGSTAAVVEIVEKELAAREKRMKELERRLAAMEEILLKEGNESGAREGDRALSKNPEASARRNHFQAELSERLWKIESRL
ncbi:MAG TPA: hypothetical protein VIB79_26570 [Candidatus Binatia bacterium]|jgi:hypothetical protein